MEQDAVSKLADADSHGSATTESSKRKAKKGKVEQDAVQKLASADSHGSATTESSKRKATVDLSEFYQKLDKPEDTPCPWPWFDDKATLLQKYPADTMKRFTSRSYHLTFSTLVKKMGFDCAQAKACAQHVHKKARVQWDKMFPMDGA